MHVVVKGFPPTNSGGIENALLSLSFPINSLTNLYTDLWDLNFIREGICLHINKKLWKGLSANLVKAIS